MSITIGIDPSLTSTGVVVTNSKQEIIYFTCIKTTNKLNLYDRVTYISQQLNKIINKFKNANIIIEAPAFAARGAMSYQIFGLHNLICLLIFRYKGMDFLQIPPTKLKKFATGKGNAKKEQMIENLPEGVRRDFLKGGFRKTTGLADLADAYWLSVFKDKIKER